MKTTVVLATYNGGKFLDVQLRSIVNQTKRPDQIVILDDGSTDATAEIAYGYKAKFSELSFHRNPSRLGPTPNFMAAVAKSTGDVVFLCDQDDYWFPTKIERVVACFEANPATSIVYHSSVLMNEAGMASATRFPDLQDHLDVSVDALQPIYGMSLAFAGNLRPLFAPEYIDLWRHESCGHDNWIYLIGAMFGSVVHIGEPLAMYRMHSTNTVGLPTEKTISNRFAPALKDYRQVLDRTRATLDAYTIWRENMVLNALIIRPDVLQYYCEVATVYEQKLRVFKADGGGPMSSLYAVLRLLRMGAYLPRARYGLRLASLPKDLLFALIPSR